MNEILATVVGWVWGTPLIVGIVGTGIFLTARLQVPQWRGFGQAIRLLRDPDAGPGELTHFQALAAALSATVGLGNIAGVAIAINTGGPGAVMWMWVIGFIGMATKSASCTLAVMYRQEDAQGRVHGGPMYYIQHGMGEKWRPLALGFAGLVTLASFGGGNMFQANQVSAALQSSFGVPALWTGIGLALAVSVVIIGGIKRIGQVASAIVPAMCGIYMLGAIAVVIVHWQQIPDAFALIFRDAFTGTSLAGGAVGIVIQQGVRRGTFSNESGLGSAPIAHAAVKTKDPATEGFVALLEPFIDTIVVCTLTALVIIFTGVYRPAGSVVEYKWGNMTLDLGALQANNGDVMDVWEAGRKVGTFRVEEAKTAKGYTKGKIYIDYVDPPAKINRVQVKPATGINLTSAGFDSVFSGFGRYFVTLAVLLFAFSTMISWSYYGEEGARFLFGQAGVLPFKVVYVAAIVAGAAWGLDAVVNFSDIAYGLMAVPNIIALWVLGGQAAQAQTDYIAARRK